MSRFTGALAYVQVNRARELQETVRHRSTQKRRLPLGGGNGVGMPSLTGNKREFVYYPGTPRLQKRAMPPLSGKSYRITAHAVIPESGAQGVIASYGGRETGVPIYLKDDRLVYENNPLHGANTVIASDIRLPRGKVVLAFDRKAQAKEDSYPYHFPSKNGKAVPLLVGAYA